MRRIQIVKLQIRQRKKGLAGIAGLPWGLREKKFNEIGTAFHQQMLPQRSDQYWRDSRNIGRVASVRTREESNAPGYKRGVLRRDMRREQQRTHQQGNCSEDASVRIRVEIQ